MIEMKTCRLRIFNVAPLWLALFTSNIAAMFCACWSFGADEEATANRLIVYGQAPGLSSSDHYAVRGRPTGGETLWQSAFVFKTARKDFGRFDPKNKGKSTRRVTV